METIRRVGDAAEMEKLMLDSWRPVAEKHAVNSDGVVALDIDTERYPEQKVDVFHVVGEPMSPDFIDAAAPLVESSYEQVREDFCNNPSNVAALDNAGEILDAGESVLLATNHTELIDIAIVGAAVNGYLKRQNHNFSTGLIVSKMVSLIGPRALKDEAGEPVSAVNALKWLCDDVYMSYPKTETTKNIPLAQSMPNVIQSHNKKLRDAIAQRLDEGGVLLAVAPSGTTDRVQPDNGICVMQEVQPGTARLMAHENTSVLPIAVNFKCPTPYMEVCDAPRKLSSPDEVHLVMEQIASTLQERTEGVKFRYT